MLTKLLSGGAGYLILTLMATGAIGATWLKYDSAIKGKAEAIQERDEARSALQDAHSTIRSQERSHARRDAANASQQDTEDSINDVPDSTQCGNSEPIKRALGIMRDNAARKADINAQ